MVPDDDDQLSSLSAPTPPKVGYCFISHLARLVFQGKKERSSLTEPLLMDRTITQRTDLGDGLRRAPRRSSRQFVSPSG